MQGFTEAVASVLRGVKRPGDFHVHGVAELMAPALEVDGVGPIALPLLPVQAAALEAVADPAPYGRGTETLVDPKVRRCWQIEPGRMRLGGRHWARTLDGIVARAASGLGVDGTVVASFYKLLLYGPGSFFVGHRDTQKAPGMFATLVVVLPSASRGGELVVRHAGQEVILPMQADDPGEAAFAAFYADCVHEVRPVMAGHRLTLVYNLIRKGRGATPAPPDHAAPQAELAALLGGWPAGEDAPRKLVYPLAHAYTPAESGFAALKGEDSAAAGVFTAAGKAAGCTVRLALLTVTESGPAEYSGGWSRDGDEEFEPVEVSEHESTLSCWDPEGPPLPDGLPVLEQDLCPPASLEDMVPDEQHFHEATGNEGASFERTYRRAALVAWPRNGLPAVLAAGGPPVMVPYFETLVAAWAASDQAVGSPSWASAQAFTGALFAAWQGRNGAWHRTETGPESRTLAALARLGDERAIRAFINRVLAAGHFAAVDTPALVGTLGVLRPKQRAEAIDDLFRAIAATQWQSCARLLTLAVQAWPDLPPALLSRAAARLPAALPGDPAKDPPRQPWQSPKPVVSSAVADLLAALCAIDAGAAQAAVQHMLAWPRRYGMDAVLVPTLRTMLGNGTPGYGIEPLREACLQHLRHRAAPPLEPPPTLARDPALGCRCEVCAQVSAFLADPVRGRWVLKVAQATRSHAEGVIKTAGADLACSTERKGTPHGLVLEKTQASYERRVKQRKRDLADIAKFGG